MWINELVIPAKGMKLDFDDFTLFPLEGRPLIYLRNRTKTDRVRVFRKHVSEGVDVFKKINGVDFEIVLVRDEKSDQFILDYAHGFNFLLLIRTGGWISAPAVISNSMFEEPPSIPGSLTCFPFVDAVPVDYRDQIFSIDDAIWIQKHLSTVLGFVNESRFQNAMQALTSFHCIPYANVCLLTAWTGLEALFGAQQEVSFRLSLYISNFLRSGEARELEFQKLKRSYDARSRVAHGSTTKVTEIREHAHYTRDILRACLQRCIEDKSLPDIKKLIFSS